MTNISLLVCFGGWLFDCADVLVSPQVAAAPLLVGQVAPHVYPLLVAAAGPAVHPAYMYM